MQPKLRKGHERRAMQTVANTEAKVGELLASEGLMAKARDATDASAARALKLVDALFRHFAQHKHDLTRVLHAACKDVCQPITSASITHAVLGRVLRGSAGIGLAEEDARHVLMLVLAVGTSNGRGRAGVEFVVPPSAVGSALDELRRECRVQVEMHEKWEALAGVVSTPVPSLKTGRYYHGAAVGHSGHVFVVGGWGDTKILGDVERLGPGDSAWHAGEALVPTARAACATCVVGNAVVVVGGWTAHSPTTNAVDAVDTATGAVASLPPLPHRVRGCGAVSLQGHVIVTGGYGRAPYSNDVWALRVGNGSDLRRAFQPQWARLPSMAQARCYHGAAAGGGCAFVCGGFNGADLASCEALRVCAGLQAWEALPPLPTPLRRVGCCYGGGNLFVAGGDPGPQRAVLALHVDCGGGGGGGGGWMCVAELAIGRGGCAAVCVGKRVLVLGGSSNEEFCLSNCEALQF